MTEPGVTLTDYGVALECALFVVLLQRGPKIPGGLRPWCTVFFASMSAASLAGGTVHGFFGDEQSLGCAVLWPATLIATGVTTLSAWAIGAQLVFSERVVRWVLVAAAIQLALYSATVLVLTQAFWVAIVDSLPAVLFLLLALGQVYRRDKHRIVLLSAVAPALTLLAALLQQLRAGLDPVYFDHNALYHVVQAIALYMFFRGTRWLVAAETVSRSAAARAAREDEPLLG